MRTICTAGAAVLLVVGILRADDSLILAGKVTNTTNPKNPVTAELVLSIDAEKGCVLKIGPPLYGSGTCAITSFDEKAHTISFESHGPLITIKANGVISDAIAGSYSGGAMAISVSLINMKGGVGKTTLAAQLAHAAARRNFRTLAVDLDPQANLSQALLSPEKYVKHLRDKKPTIVQIFEQYFPPTEGSASPRPLDISDVILKKAAHSPDLDLIVSRLELSHTLKNPTGKERRLAKALTKMADDYDLILIDCAPTESILTEAAYHASRYALVPVKPEFLATIGLPLLARSIQEFKYDNGDHALDICGIVFNHSSSYSDGPEGLRSIKEVQTEAKKNGWPVFETHVRYSRSYAKAAREGTPIGSTSYARWVVSGEFSRFVDEFFKAIGLTQGKQ